MSERAKTIAKEIFSKQLETFEFAWPALQPATLTCLGPKELTVIIDRHLAEYRKELVEKLMKKAAYDNNYDHWVLIIPGRCSSQDDATAAVTEILEAPDAE